MNDIYINTPKIVFIGTFPPTDEGIATFNEDLVNAVQKLLGRETICQVAAINLRDTSPYYFDDKVRWEIDQDSTETYLKTSEDINKDNEIKCVVIQHEYGLFGGNWGAYIADFMEKCNKPILTIMHSVLEKGPYNPKIFRKVTDRVVKNSSAIVVLSQKSKETLEKLYPDAKEIIYFIQHGIHPVKFVYPEEVKPDLKLANKTVLTTFGLLSPDKGIEYVLRALPKVIESYPNIIYQVLGQTHPVIRRLHGEKYRNSLVRLVKELGLRKHVLFVDKYLGLHELLRYLQGTDVYIATSVNPNQAVSGTFSYAVGTGRAVVSTKFVQSEEVVTNKIGRLVPAKDPKSYAMAIIDLLNDKKALRSYHKKAYTETRSMLWTNVAKNYINVIRELWGDSHKHFILPNIDLNYLKKMTTKHGILQFAKYDIPSKEHGYTVDDNARALIVTNWLAYEEGLWKEAKKLQQVYFNFLKRSQKEDGSLINYFDIDLSHTGQNDEEAPEEHVGRFLWAVAETIINPKISKISVNSAIKLWKLSISEVEKLKFLRPKAFALKAIVILYKHNSLLKEKHLELIHKLGDDIAAEFEKNDQKNWHWFEDYLSYNNAVIPESLAIAYQITRKKEYLKYAKRAFSFLMKKTFMGEVYVPIGQNGWFKKGKKRALYDQQPEDVCATVTGLITMFEITKKVKYLNLAKHAFIWFLGNNLNGIPLYNFKTGGVYDGLQVEGVNKNQGAESLVSYLLSRIQIEKYY